MRYRKTLNIWNHLIQTAIQNGAIKLQVGQWLRCGPNDGRRLCRYVGLSRGSIIVAHWQGNSSETTKRFIDAAKFA